LWTASTGDFILSSPAVVGGVVYVGSLDHKLYAFDAAGSANCSGTPTTCNPLWTATTGDSITASPAVANGTVYVGSFDANLYAFDAQGNTNCAGTPKVCTPLWTAPTGGAARSSPSVANGLVYVRSDLPPGPNTTSSLYAFDANGITNCSGSPKVCLPLLNKITHGSSATLSDPIISHGVVYYADDDARLHALAPP
jgi:outer membrane protein assembly factor BamB